MTLLLTKIILYEEKSERRVNNDFIIQSIISYRINNAINRRPLMECKQMIDMVMTLCNLTLYDLMHQTR